MKRDLTPLNIGERPEIFVEQDHGPLAEGAASFHTTRWTIVMKTVRSEIGPYQSAGSR
jgi:hypothetical protein